MKRGGELKRTAPMPRGKALGRVPSMGRADGAKAAIDALARPKRKAPMRASRPKMTAARKVAAGKPCMIRIPGVCCFDSSTTVLCHYRLATGAGTKPHDAQGAWGCNKCHDAVDGRTKTAYSTNELRLMHAEGVFRTQEAIRREAA